jgi:hypothetical protein
MQQTRIGTSGLHVSRVGLGMMSFGKHPERPWALDDAEAEPIIRRAVEGGITFFDTADVYGKGASEELTGRIVTQLLPRDELVLATKVFGDMTAGPNGRGLSRKHILSAIDASLARLASTTSTCTRSTASIPRRRSRRRWRRCTTSSARARRATSARAAWPPGSSRRPSTSPSGTV